MDIKLKDQKKSEKKKRKNLLKLKKSRIILRNVSFKVNEDIIRQNFNKFGNICEINIPKKSDGKLCGFCFVGFDAIKSALKAIKHMNGTALLGRTIAVDFALAKKAFKSQTNDTTIDDNENNTTFESTEDNQNEEVVESEDSNDDNKSDDISDDNQSVDNNGIESEVKKTIDPKILNDASEERTVFVRNLSFFTTPESLKELMSGFGPTIYCKICIDKMTEHSKGSAFVKFKNKNDANKCLEAQEIPNNSSLYLDGRQLTVSLAFTRNKLKELEEKRSLKDKDKRNLYLAKEGLIYPESPAAQSVSQPDLTKRLALETKKRKLLQNNHYFVSKTRLCVHNLPLNYDKNSLRTLFTNAVKDKSAKIIEARVMFDRNKTTHKFGKSKGFGFVEFTEHKHALIALRELNNNPNIFVPQKRPIVEFSIENRVALNRKKYRLKHNNNTDINTDNKELDEPKESNVDYSGVISRPNKKNEKIRAPKVNRKLSEMKKQLKSRGKQMQIKKIKSNNEKRHKQKLEKRKSQKSEAMDTQDSHDLHYNKRKNVFKQFDNKTIVKKTKRQKWFDKTN